MINTTDAVRSLLIPVSGSSLVLPNAAVAEVVPYSIPEAVANSPEWLLGKVSWRDQSIPLISFEVVTGGVRPDPAARSRITVLNGITGNPKLRFYAVLTQDIPRLMKIDSSVVTPSSDHVASSAVLSNVLISGESAQIPNLDTLETMLKKVV